MRNLTVFILISLLLMSCSDDDKINSFFLETVPVENVTIPESFVSGETTVISYTYLRPTTCHIFNDLYYTIDGNQRTVVVINRVFEDEGNGNFCTDLEDEIITRTFNFKVINDIGTAYTFRFWKGEDENGEDIYLTVDVPVLE